MQQCMSPLVLKARQLSGSVFCMVQLPEQATAWDVSLHGPYMTIEPEFSHTYVYLCTSGPYSA